MRRLGPTVSCALAASLDVNQALATFDRSRKADRAAASVSMPAGMSFGMPDGPCSF